MNFLSEAQALEGEMRAFFEDLHRHPEPSHFENRTNQRVREQLRAHQIDMLCPKDNITIAVIRGAKPGRTVGLRFDTDALQMQELCDVPYKSETDGLMHGCGHDAHTTCGVFVARLLKAHADALCGTYKIIFQPAEEGEHGADEVIATGLVSDVDAFYGLHVWSLYPTGTLHATPGGIWAEPDMFKVTIHGKGGHGATPEVCVDAITAGAAVVQSLQTIVSRFISPMDSVVVTVGSFHAGTRCNIIAQDAVLEGTLRAFDDDVHRRNRDQRGRRRGRQRRGALPHRQRMCRRAGSARQDSAAAPLHARRRFRVLPRHRPELLRAGRHARAGKGLLLRTSPRHVQGGRGRSAAVRRMDGRHGRPRRVALIYPQVCGKSALIFPV